MKKVFLLIAIDLIAILSACAYGGITDKEPLTIGGKHMLKIYNNKSSSRKITIC
ncbi:hypothetical protein [Alkalihalobacillus sp. BA299]|uniref:hypothetical protein n=1 Tax=Alkalihalobacillus sp. BA299 TaxID=2815938 RepID=UPI001ADAE9FB|nr:hypothetical protein [Alkalihalobacillus sp. BA299]